MASNATQTASAASEDQAQASLSGGKYLLFVAAAMAMIIGVISAVNFYMDPLWYFKGNPLTGVNYVLDERTSKPTRLANLAEQPDCLLFGTSSASLMNSADKIAGGHCFNLSVSKGHADEFVHFADWAAAIGAKPRTVIFELDAVSLMHAPPTVALPEWVMKKQTAPSPFVAYASFKALIFSVKTALSLPSLPRYYDRNFDVQIRADVPPYDPTQPHAFSDSLGPFTAEGNLEAIRTFRARWPGVRVICYAAPFAPHFSAEVDEKGHLESFTGALWQIAKACDSFRDFNIPTDLSNDHLRTYDGIHYTPDTNARMAAAFAGGTDFPQSDITGLTHEQYTQVYRQALARLGLAPGAPAGR